MSAKDDVDLTNCDREPIHILGRVQYFGALIAINDDWLIAHASENAETVLGIPAQDMIGMPLQDFLPQKTAHDFANEVMVVTAQHSSGRFYRYPVFGDDRLFDVAIHATDRHVILEFEDRTGLPAEHDDHALVQAMVKRTRAQPSIEKLAVEAAKAVRALTGFDRVMVYRFAPDHSGEVIAEAKSPKQASFMGLRFPASDIPKQARALYVRNLLRIISDVDAETPAIVPQRGADGQPLDLSMATARAVSEIHIEYLRNMGVKASMSVSLVRNGQLWGLIACHHGKPRHLSLEKRASVELFAQMINYEVDQRDLRDDIEMFDAGRGLHDRIMRFLASGSTVAQTFDFIVREIRPMIQFDGAAILSDGNYRAIGSAPTEDEFIGLSRFLNTTQAGDVFATEHLADKYPGAEVFADRVAGLLAIPVSRQPRDYIVFFRHEVSRAVKWAGNPEKPVTVGPNGVRLTPRKSFDLWTETVRGRSADWTERELRLAEAIRVTLIEVILKLTDESARLNKRAQERQELLIAELNHRVRNILNLIRGLMSQAEKQGVTLDDYSAQLDSRIQAIAIAHDQLTEKNWDWVSLTTLVQNETTAFARGQSSRIVINGPDIDLSPAAATTLVLVVHELVTNSVKYGALSDQRGQVHLDLDVKDNEGCYLRWSERNGPPVRAPERKGFGTAIVQNSIPFELKGEAEAQFLLTGLVASFRIPIRHARRGAGQVAQLVAAEPTADLDVSAKTALVLEDNMIIAMDAQNILEAIGFDTVHLTSRIDEALDYLDHDAPDFALLDVNVDDELSYPVALKCAQLGIPVLVATGYGNSQDVIDQFEGAPVVKKPYTRETVETALRKCGL